MRFAFVCLTVFTLASFTTGESSAQNERDGRQGRSAIRALPSSSKLKSESENQAASRNGSQTRDESADSTRSTSFYRQASTQPSGVAAGDSQRRDVYPYPAGNRTSFSSLRTTQPTSGSFYNQMSVGTNTTTGNLRGQAPNQRTANSELSIAQSSTTNTSASRQPPADRYASNQTDWRSIPAPANSAARTSAGYQNTAYQNAAYQAQAYRAQTYRLAQNCNCAQPGYAPIYAPAVGYAPQAAAQAPTLNPSVGGNLNAPPTNLQLPQFGAGQVGVNPQTQVALPQFGQAGCVPGYQAPGYQYAGGVGTQRFGPSSAQWWTPLIQLVGPKAGTYAGQGIIGQPTAYVDGEPLRNLLRYVFP